MVLAWPLIKDLLDFRERLNRLFDEAELGEGPSVREPFSGLFCPTADLYETDNELVIILEIPGVEADTIELRVQGESLRVAGRICPRDGDAPGRYLRMERASGVFYRDFRLPVGGLTETPTAELARGVLTVSVPRAPTPTQRRVPVIEEGP